jgi:hypothetical protein
VLTLQHAVMIMRNRHVALHCVGVSSASVKGGGGYIKITHDRKNYYVPPHVLRGREKWGVVGRTGTAHVGKWGACLRENSQVTMVTREICLWRAEVHPAVSST